MNTRNLLRTAGLMTWVVVGAPVVWRIASQGRVPQADLAVWAGAFLVFGVVFFRATRAETIPPRLIAVQTLAALAMNVVLCTSFEVALLVVVAVQVGIALPLSRGLPWLAAQGALATLLAVHHMGTSRGTLWSVAAVFAQAFAFTVAAMAGREAAARRALEKTNRELRSTRKSLARASRDAERLRIARELHNLLGHNLVALHLELETARHLATGPAREPVERAREVAKGLLADVRKAVSSLRDEGPRDIAEGVREVVDKVQKPRIHLDAPDALGVADDARATAIIRCVQEIVTNTVKHADAKNLWVTLAPRNGGVELTARDDGCGTGALRPGNGLSGMRERIERLGGELVVHSERGEGFRLRATVPLPSETPP